MSAAGVVSILGAGEIGAATAFALARRARVGDVRLVDAARDVAAGKALDMQQTGPIERFDTPLSARADVLDAVNADAIVIADAVAEGEWSGERGLALVKQIVRAGYTGPLVFAGPSQDWLMAAAAREAGVAADRLIGTAASAAHAGVRALVALEVNGSAIDVSVAVVGRAPRFTIGWTAAAYAGDPLSAQVPAHRLIAVAETARKLWPPKPQAIGAATAVAVERLLSGARRPTYATTVLDNEYGIRGAAVMLPLELGGRRVLRRIEPTLSGAERVEFMNVVDATPR
jgi:malate dehydrogenase